MRSKRRGHLVVVLALTTACGGGGGSGQDAGIDVSFPDAPESIPTLTSFVPTPASVTPGVPTAITWTWTYLVDPPIPTPTCTIDNGVGQVTSGQMTMVTLTATTTFRLTCANRVGMTARDTVITIPPAAPNIATFTVTPSPLMPNAATTVTFNWTYVTTPSPPPVCTIDGGIGTATPGMTTSLTLGQARTFRLRCQNTQGTQTRDATVAVNECAGATAQCGANATCTDTVDSYTCACNSGYAGNGDVCSATNLNCTTPGVCSSNATCSGGTTCVCNTGFMGDGLTCTRAKLMFVTSTSGTGQLSTWGGTGTGAAQGDAICQARATAAGLPGTYVAWLSDSASDAYCRVHGFTGKKSAMCGQGALPTGAGPWLRTDAARQPALPTIEKAIAPTRQTFYPASFSEFGSDVTSGLAWTATDDNGVLSGNACNDWASADGTGTYRGVMGDLNGGGTSWTAQSATGITCNSTGRLRCMEVGSGPALPPRHPANVKRAFVTSVSGSGLLSTWSDAQGLTSISAADAICQSRARYAGYANAASFEAWASYSFTNAYNRVTNAGPWYRPDGILFATRSQLTGGTSGRISAPLYMTETNAYVAGNADAGSVWTGTTYSGSYYSSSASCSSWQSTSSSGIIGRTDLADFRWVAVGSSTSLPSLLTCSATDYRLYCLDDSF
jgi:hypothetical protein